MRVTALIADDEAVARHGLADMLRAFDWIACVAEVSDGLSAVEAIERMRPELVFLDVEMPGLRGIEVLRRLQHSPYVIFTTAYSEFAVTAFELGAVDYLVKPFGQERLAAALERVRNAVGEPTARDVVDRLAGIFDANRVSRLFVRHAGGLTPVLVKDIAYLEADGDYVAAYARRVRHLVRLPLSRLEKRLDPARFVRVHRACVVNLDHLASFRPAPQGRMVAVMVDGTRLVVSRARAQEFRELGL